jgi:hypothetical protein
MIIYLATRGEYSDYRVCHAFARREDAEAYKLGDDVAEFRWFVLDQPAGSGGPEVIPDLIREHDQVVAAWRSGPETGDQR